MYRVSAFVLRRNDFSHTKSIVTLFSDEFGKFDCFFTFSKTSPKLDIGSLISASIQTKKGTNTLVSIHTHALLDVQGWDYALYELFLWFTFVLYTFLPEWNQYPAFFSDISSLFWDKHDVHEQERLYYVVLRFLMFFGIYKDTFSLSSDQIQRMSFDSLLPQLQNHSTQEIKQFAHACCDHFDLGV